MPLRHLGEFRRANTQHDTPMNALLILILWLAQTSAEIALGKLLEKLLTKRNLKRLNVLLKKQILLIYFHWVLLKTPLKSLREQPQQNTSQTGG
jgi:hypothetical protein